MVEVPTWPSFFASAAPVPGQTVTLVAIDPIDAELFEVLYRDDFDED